MSTAVIPLLTVENYKILPETGPRYQLIETYFLAQDAANPAATYGQRDTFASDLFPGLTFDAAVIFAR